MSYVDMAWPFGVALIGLQIAVMGDGKSSAGCASPGLSSHRLRMGIGALTMPVDWSYLQD